MVRSPFRQSSHWLLDCRPSKHHHGAGGQHYNTIHSLTHVIITLAGDPRPKVELDPIIINAPSLALLSCDASTTVANDHHSLLSANYFFSECVSNSSTHAPFLRTHIIAPAKGAITLSGRFSCFRSDRLQSMQSILPTPSVRKIEFAGVLQCYRCRCCKKGLKYSRGRLVPLEAKAGCQRGNSFDPTSSIGPWISCIVRSCPLAGDFPSGPAKIQCKYNGMQCPSV